MTQYTIHFSEHNSFIDESAFRSIRESDGWFDNEYRIPFEAETLEEAKSIAEYKCDTSSGVFDVCDESGKIVFTEEDL